MQLFKRKMLNKETTQVLRETNFLWLMRGSFLMMLLHDFVFTKYILIVHLSGWPAYRWKPDRIELEDRLDELKLNKTPTGGILICALTVQVMNSIVNLKELLPVAHCCKSRHPSYLKIFLFSKEIM